MGGSATTAAILKMVVLFVATHPHVHNRLIQELDAAEEAGLLSPVLQHKVIFINLLPFTEFVNQAKGNEAPPLPHRNTE